MGVRERILYKVEKILYKALNKKNNETLKKEFSKKLSFPHFKTLPKD